MTTTPQPVSGSQTEMAKSVSTPGVADAIRIPFRGRDPSEMPTNEEGEFELVLGNKQLLSVFFIVVLLLGVFFTMGYIVGRNTMPGGTQLASGKGAPIIVDPPVSSPSPAPAPASDPGGERPSPSGATPVPPTKSAEPPVTTAPKPEPVKPEPPKPEPKKAAPPKPVPAKLEPSKPAPAKVEPPKPAPAAGGTYLQVAATRKAEADLLAEVLSKKGHPTVVTPIPDSALVRVLVGPLSSDAIPKTREALEAAGFKPFARKL